MVLRLHKNNLSGRIPESFCRSSNLQILDVAYNNLTGIIPGCLGELNAMVDSPRTIGRVIAPYSNETVIQVMNGHDLTYIKTWQLVFSMDLSSNKLAGEIPVELTALTMLMGLNLSNNHLRGVIPHNIGNMTGLFSLDLSGNELKGLIPPSMAALTFLGDLNLSHNNLSGRIPTGNQLQLFTESSFLGNKDLCGPPLPKNCPNHEDATTATNKKKHARELWLFYVDIMSGFITGFCGVIGFLLFKKQWRQKLFMFAEKTMDKMKIGREAE